MSYEEFKGKIIDLLTKNQIGLTWTSIREQLQLPQTVPNNQWVLRIVSETGMQRKKDDGDTFWYLPIKGVVYTIGYEGKTIKQFIAKLKFLSIDQLVDVREIALSRKNGFAKTALKRELEANGIVYKHLPELGSPREIRHKLHADGNYDEFFKEYSKYLDTEEPQKALVKLGELAHMRRTVIMCFEYHVDRCHRKIIKERLTADGFGVVDL